MILSISYSNPSPVVDIFYIKKRRLSAYYRSKKSLLILSVKVTVISITDVALRDAAYTTTTVLTTTTLPPQSSAQLCVFPDSATCSPSEHTVCSSVVFDTCIAVETSPYPVHAVVSQASGAAQQFTVRLYADGTCSSSLFGALAVQDALPASTCATAGAANKVCSTGQMG